MHDVGITSGVDTTAALVRRARAVVQRAQAMRAFSLMLTARARDNIHAATLAREQLLAARAERQRAARPAPRPRRWVRTIQPLPLTSPQLLELAAEFNQLADVTNTPDGRDALRDLACRYVALAAGFDTQAIGSFRLH